MRYLMLLALVGITFGETYQVKDRSGIAMVEIIDVKMFRYSDYFHKYIPDFKAVAKNIYWKDWNNAPSYAIPLIVTVHKKDGSKADFPVSIDICFSCDFLKDSTKPISHPFMEPHPYEQEDFESIEFSFADSFQSPEDKRLAAIEQAKKDAERAKKEAADAARRKRLAAEQRKKEAEEGYRLAQ
jgi:hypothetical protein